MQKAKVSVEQVYDTTGFQDLADRKQQLGREEVADFCIGWGRIWWHLHKRKKRPAAEAQRTQRKQRRENLKK